MIHLILLIVIVRQVNLIFLDFILKNQNLLNLLPLCFNFQLINNYLNYLIMFKERYLILVVQFFIILFEYQIIINY